MRAFLFVIGIAIVWAQKSPYQLFNSEGKPITYEQMLQQALQSDIVLFGELHNNPIAHWFQRVLTQDLYDHKKVQLILGAEMFERDDQLIIDEYLQGFITERQFCQEAKCWNNFETDYKPLLDFAKRHQLRFIATNVPRRYAQWVFKKGIEGLKQLPKEAHRYFVRLPLEVDTTLQSYRAMLTMGAGHGGSWKIVYAQALKDATMAESILKHWKKGMLFLHFNGAYHSNYHEGIVYYLKKQKPKLKIFVIATVEQDQINALEKEHLEKGDVIICVDSRFPKSY